MLTLNYLKNIYIFDSICRLNIVYLYVILYIIKSILCI